MSRKSPNQKSANRNMPNTSTRATHKNATPETTSETKSNANASNANAGREKGAPSAHVDSAKGRASSSARSQAASSPRMSTHVAADSTFPVTPHWVLPLIIGVYVALTLLLIARVPLGKAPDEIPHMLYVETLAQRGQLPVFDAAGGTTNPGYEFHQPPLYYALCAPLWRVAGAGVQNYACRLVSLVCGAATLWFLWNAVATLFPQRRELPMLATAFAALLPMHQAAGASANNDALAGLLCAAVFNRVAYMSTHAAGRRDAVVMGVLIGLGLLTKTTFLAMGVVALCALWMPAANRDRAENESTQGETTLETLSAKPSRLSAALPDSVVMIGVALLLSGWWLARNGRLYGDIFALGTFNRAFGNEGSGALAQGFFAGMVPPLAYARAMILTLFCTFWGVFGGPNTALEKLNPFGNSGPRADALAAVPAMMVCALASALVLCGLWRCGAKWRAQSAIDSQERARRFALCCWMLGFALVFAAWLQFNTHYFQAQARYFHPALLPIALGFALGWRAMLSSRRALIAASALFALTLLGLSLWNAFGWRTLV